MAKLSDYSLREITNELKNRKITCPRCGGFGIIHKATHLVNVVSGTISGTAGIPQTCSECFGAGLIQDKQLEAIVHQLSELKK